MILNGENSYDRRLEASWFSSLSRRMGWIKDCAEGIQKDLACPDETISKMLRSVAETFDNTVEDLLDKAEDDWEVEK